MTSRNQARRSLALQEQTKKSGIQQHANSAMRSCSEEQEEEEEEEEEEDAATAAEAAAATASVHSPLV